MFNALHDFVYQATTFPTLVYTVLLGVVSLYWLLVILGLSEVLDVDIDLDADSSAYQGLTGLLVSLGFGGVPLPLVISILVLLSWLFSYVIGALLLPRLDGGVLRTLGGIGVMAVSLPLALPVTVRIVRPLKKLFVVHRAAAKNGFIGMRCEIRTLTVNSEFGQALLADGGAGMLLQVRITVPNALTKGDIAVIVAYDPQADTYLVTPYTATFEEKNP
ncbi:MAG: ubiquinone biosynthesis protein [Gammaproteobacteria bacterium]